MSRDAWQFRVETRMRLQLRERVLAGLARARQAGTQLGRKFTEDTKEGSRKVKAVLALRAKGIGYRKIAQEVGLGVGTVMRVTASQEISRPFEGASVAGA
jgi:DNA invertase Pin-like site-specific DNA recombinase